MDGDIDEDVYDCHYRDVAAGGEISRHVERDEAQLHEDDEDERLVLRHARAHDLVLDVILVRMEQGAAVSQANQEDTDHIEARNDEQRADQHPVFVVKRRHVGVVHGELDEQEGQHVAQRQTARVAHEDFLLVPFAQEKIEIEIGDEHPHEPRNHDAVNPKLLADEAEQIAAQRDERETGCQSVDSVNQVESIDNQNDDENRQQTARHGRQLMNAGQSVEVVEVETAEGQQGRSQDLDRKLHLGVEPNHVVDDANGVDNDGSHHDRIRPKAHPQRSCTFHIVERKDAKHEGKEHAGQEGYAAEAGYRVPMHLAGVGQII